jgi:hypothetical protein
MKFQTQAVESSRSPTANYQRRVIRPVLTQKVHSMYNHMGYDGRLCTA